MMGTGARIGEALAVLGDQVDADAAEVEITHTIIRVKGQGLIRKRTKSRAGERRLKLPASIATMVQARLDAGLPLDGPLFPNTLGGFRDPNNTRRELREARGDGLLSWVTSHNFRKSVATILDDAGHTGARSPTRSATPRSRWRRTSTSPARSRIRKLPKTSSCF